MSSHTRPPHPFADVHPLARSVVRTLPVHPLYVVNKPGLTERQNITADLDEHAVYPAIDLSQLTDAYARALSYAHPGIDLSGEQVLFTRGSVEGLDLLIRAFCEPGIDQIVTNSPSFPEYARLAALNGNQTVSIPLAGADFDLLDERTMLAASGKILFLCNPNNPIGSLLDPVAVRRLIAGFPGIVVVDEAYAELASGDFESAVGLIGSHDNLVVLRTFSKAWGLAGVRVGAVLSSPQILNALRKLVNPFSLNADTQKILASRLAEPAKPLTAAKLIAKRRTALVSALEKLPSVYKIYPGNANFILIRVRSSPEVTQRLATGGCLASDFSHVLPDAIKITIGTEDELANTLDALTNAQTLSRLA